MFVSWDIFLTRTPVTMAICGARRRSLVLINAVMATQIPPLDNSFCNYADDTPGGHFEMNTVAQRWSLYVFRIVKGWSFEATECRTRFPQPRKRVTNTINGRQVKLCYRNSLWCGREMDRMDGGRWRGWWGKQLDGMLMLRDWLKQIESSERIWGWWVWVSIGC